MAGERRQRLFAGWAAAALGIFGLVTMWLHPENLRTEAWVAYAAMSSFVFAGGGILAGEYGRKRLGDWIWLLAVAALLATAAWVTFGPGPRNCTALLFFIGPGAAEWACRGAFGVGTLLLLLLLGAMARRLTKT